MIRILILSFFMVVSLSYEAHSQLNRLTKIAMRKAIDEGFLISDQKIKLLTEVGIKELYDKKDDLEHLLHRIQAKKDAEIIDWNEYNAGHIYSAFIFSICVPWVISIFYLPDHLTILGLPFSASASLLFQYFYQPKFSNLDVLIAECEELLTEFS